MLIWQCCQLTIDCYNVDITVTWPTWKSSNPDRLTILEYERRPYTAAGLYFLECNSKCRAGAAPNRCTARPALFTDERSININTLLLHFTSAFQLRIATVKKAKYVLSLEENIVMQVRSRSTVVRGAANFRSSADSKLWAYSKIESCSKIEQSRWNSQ